VGVARLPRYWFFGSAYGVKFILRQHANSLPSFHLLKRDQSMPECGVKRAINWTSPISKIRQALFGFESIFEREFLALGAPGNPFIGHSCIRTGCEGQEHTANEQLASPNISSFFEQH
jgi:hypothetical protein